jgi:hypothetical protein
VSGSTRAYMPVLGKSRVALDNALRNAQLLRCAMWLYGRVQTLSYNTILVNKTAAGPRIVIRALRPVRIVKQLGDAGGP